MVNLRIELSIKKVEIKINPKKNDHIAMGCLSSTCVTTLAKENILVPIPNAKTNKKLPFTASQNALNFPVKNSLKFFGVNDRSELSNSS